MANFKKITDEKKYLLRIEMEVYSQIEEISKEQKVSVNTILNKLIEIGLKNIKK